MERSEKVGLGVAGVAHVLLFAALSLGLLTTSKPKPIVTDSLDVTLTDEIGKVSTATERAIDPPAPSEAPDKGKPEEAAPPEPSPAPPAPAPKPAPPEPTPAPPLPAPKAKPVPPQPAPKPKPAPPKPAPKPTPQPKPAPKPAPEKPAPPAKAETKPAPAKSAPAKTVPGKAAPSTAAPARSTAKPAAKPGEGAGEGTKPKATGSRLGKDFLKGIADTSSPSKSTTPHAAVVGAREMAGLAALLLQQVKPCYNPPAGGTEAGQIATVLDLKMNKDGSVASVEIGDQTGVNGQNAAYAKQMADAARRAVLRCAPFKLPAELYEGGWDDFGFRFRP